MELDIRARGLDPTPGLRRDIEVRLRRHLGPFEARVQRVTVQLIRDHGRGRHAAHGCLLTVSPRGIPPLRARHWHRSIRTAFHLAAAQARRGLVREVHRQRTLPHGRRAAAGEPSGIDDLTMPLAAR
jgi:hypothetical protein